MEPIYEMNVMSKAQPLKPWPLAAKLLDFDGSGVVDFRSPYSIEVLDGILERLQTKIWSGDYIELDDKSIQIFRALMPRWRAMTLYLLQLRLIKERSAKEKRKPLVTYNVFPTLPAYLEGDILPDHDTIDYLTAGVRDPEFWRWPWRMLRWHNRTIKRYPKGLVCPADTLISAYSTSVEKWLERGNIGPVMWEPSWFFSPLDKADLSPLVPRGSIDKLTEFIDHESTAIGIPLDEQDKTWLTRQLSLSAAAARMHLDAALNAQMSVPKRFLSAATGSIWDRLLRVAVKMNGGHVTGFEHGCGLGFEGTPCSYFDEWFNCDHYVTRSELSLRLIKEADHVYKDLPITVPTFDPADLSEDDKEGCKQSLRSLNLEVPTILFVPFGTSGERARGTVLPPDITAVDFNARCIDLLKGMGFKVIIKPHPAEKGPGILAYIAKLGIEGTERMFEEVLDQADLVVTCDPRSTTTIITINSRIPVVILDIETPKLSPALLCWMKKRADVLACHFNKSEQIEFDALALRAVLSKHLPL